MSIELTPLAGTNPLGFLAALGTLGALERAAPCRPRLRWPESVVPRAVLDGYEDLDEVISILDQDRQSWATSIVINSGPSWIAPDDIKPQPAQLGEWARLVRARTSMSDRRDADLLGVLLAEGATAGKGDCKPTHLHFTAGQQKFLVMIRQLADKVGPAQIEEALRGPWRYESPLPVLGWDARGERIFALRGTDPSKEKRLGVPGADWLAFLGLLFLPVVNQEGALRTTCCAKSWKTGHFRWPLWSVPLPANVTRSLLGFAGLANESPARRRARGVYRVLEAPIHRSDQGGYGSIGAATDADAPQIGVSRHVLVSG